MLLIRPSTMVTTMARRAGRGRRSRFRWWSRRPWHEAVVAVADHDVLVVLSCERGLAALGASAPPPTSRSMTIHLPQRKDSSAEAASGQQQRSDARGLHVIFMARMLALGLLNGRTTVFAGDAVAVAVHLHARAVLQELRGFLAGIHLRAMVRGRRSESARRRCLGGLRDGCSTARSRSVSGQQRPPAHGAGAFAAQLISMKRERADDDAQQDRLSMPS